MHCISRSLIGYYYTYVHMANQVNTAAWTFKPQSNVRTIWDCIFRIWFIWPKCTCMNRTRSTDDYHHHRHRCTTVMNWTESYVCAHGFLSSLDLFLSVHSQSRKLYSVDTFLHTFGQANAQRKLKTVLFHSLRVAPWFTFSAPICACACGFI